MGISIGTNTSALNSLRHLNESVSAEVRTEGKLASGSRIVQAADDAAGLAISSKMNAEIRSYRQSLRNTNDAVSVVQTADGAMSEIASLLIRVRELALQSASGQYTDHDRRMIDTEVQSNLKEITRIAEATEYNGAKLLDGSAQPIGIQVGIHDSESSQVLLNRADQAQTARALGLERVDVLSQYNARMALPRLDYALNSVSESRASLGALQNRLQSVAENIKVSEQNASNSHSRIKDADFAYESAELVRSRLMREAGTGILAQANSSSAIALRLLG